MKKFFLASLALSPLYLSTQVIHAEKFTLAVMGDPQYKWSCSAEQSIYPKDVDINTLSDYCYSVQGQKINQEKDSNEKAIKAIKNLRDNASTPFKGLIINGDLTSFGHDYEREFFHNNYTIHNPKKDDLLIYPGLGNHDYQNNVNDCGAKDTQGRNNCAGGMMHIMADWILGYKGLDKGKTPVCNKLLISCDIYAFNKNPWQTTGNRNVNGSLAYSWEIGDFRFIQLQNYPHYTVTFKRGWNKGASSWTMQAKNSMVWLGKQLEDAHNNNKYVVLNLHDIQYYFNENGDQKKELEDLIKQYQKNIRAIFVGHLHQRIGKHGSLGGVDIIYSGAPIAGRFLKVEFDSTKTDPTKDKTCITVTPTMTVAGTPLNPLTSFTIKCEPLPEPTPTT